MIEIIIGIVLLIGGFTGGYLTSDVINANTPAKTNIQNITTSVETSTVQQNLQIQSTVFSANTNITISIKDYTNYLKFSSKSNTITNK